MNESRSAGASGKLGVADLDVAGKRVFVRVDYNVPLRDGQVADDRRIRESLPTVKHILTGGGKPILASHLGRPKGKPVAEMSLAPVAPVLERLLGAPVRFAPSCVGDEAQAAAAALAPGEALLLENLRFHPEEEKNDPGFAARLASLADLYVNDAFGSAHRAHASTEAIARLLPLAAAGFLMDKELGALSRLQSHPDRPYVAILGGAKISDKIPLVENLLSKVDAFAIGGAMAYTFLRARGAGTGDSRVEESQVEFVRALLDRARAAGVAIHLPEDHVALAAGVDDPAAARTIDTESIPDGWRGVDIGPASARRFAQHLATARTVLWNGPLGWFEKKPFDAGTRAVAEAVAGGRSFSVIGGGDTAAAVAEFGLDGRFGHVSTGGGASLEFLSGLVLPGVAALTERRP
jgi:phosphoglycerate kinase